MTSRRLTIGSEKKDALTSNHTEFSRTPGPPARLPTVYPMGSEPLWGSSGAVPLQNPWYSGGQAAPGIASRIEDEDENDPLSHLGINFGKFLYFFAEKMGNPENF